MDGDMNDIFQKINTMLEDKDMADNLKNIINNFSSSNSEKKDDDSQKSSSNNIPNFDMETILKMKSIMDSFNNTSGDARSNLLLSLKPYLADKKKEKIDQYIKFLQFAKVVETLGVLGGDKKTND